MGLMRRLMGKPKRKDEHYISLHDVREATNNFNDENVIGSGGFGKVYRGYLKDGTEVAVKRRDKDSRQGAEEFEFEKELLFRLEHPNLVSLIKYCDEKGEMILVYEYMKEGTLQSHLYGSNKPPLSWEQRLEASTGAAKGLNYLHSNGIIHRDVKSLNILLDENLCAKMGDLGMSKAGPELDETHVSTRVIGTIGYLDLQYWMTGHLSVKSDVGSFGAVLLEVLCGRAVIDHRLSAEKVNLVCWGKKMLEEGNVAEIVDEKIRDTTHPHNLAMFGSIVLRCLAEENAERPTMEEVLRDLEWELGMVRAGNPPDESVHGSASVAAENSGESGHAAVSSQEKKVKALERSQGKTYERSPSVSHELSATSTSRAARLSGSRFLQGRNGNAMKMKGPVELESISEDENCF
uniref:PTO-like protein kinase n=1 Tax=Zea mays TaxID=4577 RepID=B0LUZ4_MAIZE|nr:PTO-like protein kinase [Zea mays]|eukprot:NP_001108126.1 PTO-like protein kinase [Zea mays]